MFFQVLNLPQVKQCAVTTYKYGIHELPHESPNDFESGKTQNVIE